MDFGAVALEGLVGSDNPSSGFGSERGNKYGSGCLKQERSDAIDDDWRSSKVAKVTESMLLPQRNSLPKSNGSSLFPQQQQMLSFSCPKSEAPQSLSMPGFHLISYPYSRTAGYESLNSGNMHGVFTETRGPFTPSQWMELEHQALIYKYITANVPIPTNLLTPIRRALDSAISAYSGGLLLPNTLSWGGWNLGFSGNSDPEPGRCRRTDGKKWRCSRDAVADQKYCERHMNRGRHRSRKHVEGQSGHSAAAAASKPALTVSSASPVAVGLHGGGASCIAQNQQLKNPSNLSASSATSLNRMFLSKETLGERSKLDPKTKENPFLILKQQSPYPESTKLEFGRVNSDSLLNPSHNNSSIITSKTFDSNPDLTYRLSISIPVGPADFMSSTSSPNHEKSALLPPRQSCDLDLNAFNQRQANWLPVSWETSMGGPLGEVLQNGNSNSGSECKSGSSVLTHLKDGWDSGSSPGFGSSPIGVLQKPTFGSLSNSSAGSSPRVEGHRASEGASLCCEFLAPV